MDIIHGWVDTVDAVRKLAPHFKVVHLKDVQVRRRSQWPLEKGIVPAVMAESARSATAACRDRIWNTKVRLKQTFASRSSSPASSYSGYRPVAPSPPTRQERQMPKPLPIPRINVQPLPRRFNSPALSVLFLKGVSVR